MLNLESNIGVIPAFAVSMSEFRKNPAAVLRKANNRPVAVLKHNRAAFYIIEPHLFEAMLEETSTEELYQTVVRRLAQKAHAIEIAIGDL